jgi:hypothetical protein
VCEWLIIRKTGEISKKKDRRKKEKKGVAHTLIKMMKE